MYSDIVGSPLQVDLRYVPAAGGTPPPSSHLLGGGTGSLLRAALKSYLEEEQKAAFDRILDEPLDQVFHTLWAGQREAIARRIAQAIREQEPSAYDIVPTLPVRGTLRAQLHEHGTYSEGFAAVVPAGSAATQLSLVYDVPRVRVSFEAAVPVLPDPGMELTFDVRLGLYLAVPGETRYGIQALANVHLRNTDLGSGSLYSGLVTGLRNVYLAAMQRPFVPPGEQITPVPLADLAGLGDQLGFLSQAFGMASRLGFRELTVGIEAEGGPDASVRFTLTHPFDPAPDLRHTAPSRDVFVPLTRWATDSTRVPAGGQITFSGTGFTVRPIDEIHLTWNDTTSGRVAQTEVQWGPAGPGGTHPVSPDTARLSREPYDGVGFRPTGLAADTAYAFRIRHHDMPGLVATAWSPWVVARTGVSDVVQIVLDDPARTVVAETAVESSGNFSGTLTVPVGLPPGPYALWATMSGSRIAMADRPIEVLPAQAAAPPSIVVYSSAGVPFRPGLDRFTHGRAFDVRGANFRPGPVELFADEPGGTPFATAQADALGSWQLRPVWRSGVGYHTVVAVQGDLRATSVELNFAPRPH
ncbi:fibronectin type III domain-containing protein [Streptomyces aidingensis]|uniref:Uncharacterized protein n=1 Tax=Streptomyces aidingensis TaxID=910347 RepID=A0A1I1N5N7_9ACTN|nr:fibronectin type III domain-containing protein [Streptomyces aidingensis]SFC92646.1 hypothetical protein SAMN05421773_107224 [Streptomyces aidingensis]